MGFKKSASRVKSWAAAPFFPKKRSTSTVSPSRGPIVKWVLGTGIFVIVFAAYLVTLSQNYIYDFAAWYWPALETHPLAHPTFWYQNHLLHLPLEYIIYRLWLFFGYTGSAILPTQIVSALAGALVAMFLFLTVRDILGDYVTALAVAFCAAFSRGLWVMSTDAWYYPLYLLGATVAVWLMAPVLSDQPGVSQKRILAISVLMAITILVAQFTVLVIPAMVVVLWMTKSFQIRADRWKNVLVFGFIVALLVGAGYLTVGATIFGYRSVREFLMWGTNHTVFPGFGVWELDRFVLSVPYFIGSSVPLTEGMGLRALLQGDSSRLNLVPFLSLFGFLVFLLVLTFYAFKYRRQLWQSHRTLIVFCLTWIVPMWVFITWYEPLSMAGCNLTTPVWLLFALVLNHARQRLVRPWRSLATIGLGLLVLLLVAGNLVGAIWPRHTQPNTDLEKAQMAGSHMDEGDVLIGVRWDWTLYLPYFGNRETFNMASGTEGKWTTAETRQRLCGIVFDQLQEGKRTFIVDTSLYTQASWDWLLSSTGAGLQFKAEDFDRLPRRLAWVFADGERVWELLPCSE